MNYPSFATPSSEIERVVAVGDQLERGISYPTARTSSWTASSRLSDAITDATARSILLCRECVLHALTRPRSTHAPAAIPANALEARSVARFITN